MEIESNVYPNVASDYVKTVKLPQGYLAAKRALDIILSVILIILCFIPMLIIGILVGITSKGPVFFSQERLGLDGKPYMMFKFRTMVKNAEANGPQWADAEDERCTAFGWFLRKYHLDELPQLFNILKGDMTFIGPRPEREYFYELFEKELPDFRVRLMVKPGLTGLSQVSMGYEITPAEKLEFDKEYIKNMSFGLDAKIFFKTFGAVFSGNGVI